MRALVVIVVLGGCVAEPADPQPALGPRVVTFDLATSTLETQAGEPDICGLAAALPADDLCSLACDPDALAERAVSEGMPGGRCYQFRCALSADVTVSVGICL